MFPLRGLDLFFPSSVLAVVDSESLELLDEEEEDGFLLNFVTAGGDGFSLVVMESLFSYQILTHLMNC